ncbi:nucleoside-triphosphate diphosphatase [Monocercomonoides exilis]|uniref:nucleoside-triphosphate diphosphatase n=1 Tax=Monocercomonoides exilis TaxID=2049356 RepID=UPI00355A89F4|nr:nucleoside-triphosphate diphosphatase [Monocercomonoides exilis]|eukprot:MONOS_441.1-p1 / transcript=MONOS_441.1 / gene=MONOS_441 / organism=Monocercomonoides_exilis_PA203 / gene_product=nucleoside-triphosphate diphosphatase [EC:3.6.1.19] / transcript_product=nucleoside-triphosphate diphosphatase [EC:3.6.1.19] / location=Mono_scaffold00007:97352-98287(+) / protein_length=208 / sequence_SO=supercontig / SO=protein_coding / is_pseudo=false
MSSNLKLYFVTGNENKLREVREMTKDLPISIEPFDADLPELQGDPEDVCREKCKIAYSKVKAPCIVEDTCLCFNALGGLPGVYIKWFLIKCGHEGLNKMLDGFDDRSAYAMCTFGLALNDGEPILFPGKTNGHIVRPRGTHNFGWDPVFEEDASKKTFAEMTAEEKNSCSHRSKALHSFLNYLKEHQNDISHAIENSESAKEEKKKE